MIGDLVTERKAPDAFRTISEVAANLEVPQHVLRFWESKFHQVKPLKRAGGRRYYRPEDVVLLSNIKELLYTQGFTIKGVQKLLKETGRHGIVRPSQMKQASGENKPSSTTAVPPVATGLASAPSIAPVIAAATLASPSMGLSTSARREMETLLGELKTMREMLRESGV
jgi:DNA-binding transcriptional MerR regulator